MTTGENKGRTPAPAGRRSGSSSTNRSRRSDTNEPRRRPRRDGVEFGAERKYGRWTLTKRGFLARDVWRVQDPQTAEIGVIKRARDAPAGPERFGYEVRVLERLQNQPGVLRLVDRDSANPPRWMVMEQAQPLAAHLGDNPDLHAVVHAIAEIAEALLAAKAVDIAHRDLKPDNFFYARGRAVLGDFGLATGHGDNLTMVGGKVGPANFNAPETMEWEENTDPYPADVYSLAKSLWVLAAGGTRYPPPGTLLIRQRHTDLSRRAGRAAEDLARLLELATEHGPYARPDLEGFLAELRNWLTLHSAGTTPRPDPDKRPGLRTLIWGAQALEVRGLEAVVDYSIQQLLDRCRRFQEGARVNDHPAPDSSEFRTAMAGGDPDWEADWIVAKRLTWTGVATVRLVAIGVLVSPDDLHYQLEWQLRSPGTQLWTTTWQDIRRVRMRLPSDVAERQQLRVAAEENMPQELSDAPVSISPEIAGGLRKLARASADQDAAQESDREVAMQRVSARLVASAAARAQLDELWRDLTRAAEEAVADDDDVTVRSDRQGDSWLLQLGETWRLVLRVAEAPSHLTALLVGGSVEVHSSDTASDGSPVRSEVANVAALFNPTGDPDWQLLRFQSNDKGQPYVRTSRTAFDDAGAVDLNALEQHFVLNERLGMRYPSLLEALRTDLSIEILLELLFKEGGALSEELTST